MISKKMAKALNKQVNAELYSAYLYFSMSSYSSFIGLQGFAHWFFVQAQEEMTHVLRIYGYLNSVGQHAVLEAIEGPPAKFESAIGMFEATLKHEKKVTAMINNLVNLAASEKDHATEVFLQWFVSEQVEEVDSVNTILAKLKLAGDKGGGLFLMDQEVGARVFTPPAGLVMP
ncbi:MAG: ferritin [Candidatus Eiseniibacteriota bacterium]|nr:MAG: ferritin [Candidatus Eisenbacteria bacterium]